MKTKNIKRVPKLRFSEFEGEWEEYKLRKIARGGFNNGVFNEPDKTGRGYRLINVKDMYVGEKIGVDNLTLLELKEEEFLKNKVECGDVFFTRSSLVKEGIAYSSVFLGKHDDVTYDGHLIRMRPNKSIADSLYLAYLFKTFTARKQFIVRGKTTTMTTIGQEDIASVEVFLPTLPEQEKIASFLSAVDKKIQQFTRKKELLEQYKKGVMQKIFSQKIRFTDDNAKDYPDWQDKKLGDVLTFISTNSLTRNDLNYEIGEIKNIHYGDIHTTFKMGFNAAKEKVPYVNETIDLRKVTKEQFCQVGDVVIADASEDYNDIGKAIEIYDLSGEKILAGLHTFLGRDKTGQTSNGFKGYLLQVNSVRKQIQVFAQGISVLGISKTNLAKVKFKLPCKKEQIKIVTLLKNIDKKILSIQSQLSQTQTFKKGLLQQMFV